MLECGWVQLSAIEELRAAEHTLARVYILMCVLLQQLKLAFQLMRSFYLGLLLE